MESVQTGQSVQGPQIVPNPPSAQAVESRQATEVTNKRVDIVQARESINNLVASAAEEIAKKLIEAAKDGQLAVAKYLFEAVGLYPPTEETKTRPKEDSLAYTLLRRMGLPTEPLNDKDIAPVRLIGQREMPRRKSDDIAEKQLAEGADEKQKPDSSE